MKKKMIQFNVMLEKSSVDTMGHQKDEQVGPRVN